MSWAINLMCLYPKTIGYLLLCRVYRNSSSPVMGQLQETVARGLALLLKRTVALGKKLGMSRRNTRIISYNCRLQLDQIQFSPEQTSRRICCRLNAKQKVFPVTCHTFLEKMDAMHWMRSRCCQAYCELSDFVILFWVYGYGVNWWLLLFIASDRLCCSHFIYCVAQFCSLDLTLFQLCFLCYWLFLSIATWSATSMCWRRSTVIC